MSNFSSLFWSPDTFPGGWAATGRPAGWTETVIIELTQSSLAGTRLSLANTTEMVIARFLVHQIDFMHKTKCF